MRILLQRKILRFTFECSFTITLTIPPAILGDIFRGGSTFDGCHLPYLNTRKFFTILHVYQKKKIASKTASKIARVNGP